MDKQTTNTNIKNQQSHNLYFFLYLFLDTDEDTKKLCQVLTYPNSNSDGLHFGHVGECAHAFEYRLVVLVDERLYRVRVHVHQRVVEPDLAGLQEV